MTSGPCFIGLNSAGEAVYETDTGLRFAKSPEGFEYHETAQHSGRWFLRATTHKAFQSCAEGLGETIAADPSFTRQHLERFFADLFEPDGPHYPMSELIDMAGDYLALTKPGAFWRLQALLEAPEPVARQIESDPIIFIGIEGVITSLKTRMFRRSFDPDAIGLIARLADKTGAKLMLMTPMRRTWPAGAEALHQTLIAEGLPADLWHREMMLPKIDGGTTWQELDAWLAGRDCDALSALIIEQGGDPYPGELPGDVYHYDTSPPDGFTQWDYFKIMAAIGVEDGEVEPPPGRPASGFRAMPARWRGREIAPPASSGPVPVRSFGF